MAPYQKKPSKKSHNWLLTCFGISVRTTTAATFTSTSTCTKKAYKPATTRKGLFKKLCMPKIKVIVIRRNKKAFAIQPILNLKVNEGAIKWTKEVESEKTRPEWSDEQKKSTGATDTMRRNSNYKARKDSLIGMSMMVIMLGIMSTLGHLCAILCMSLCLYSLPLLTLYKDFTPRLDSIRIHMASLLYYKKKKAVLARILQRDVHS